MVMSQIGCLHRVQVLGLALVFIGMNFPISCYPMTYPLYIGGVSHTPFFPRPREKGVRWSCQAL